MALSLVLPVLRREAERRRLARSRADVSLVDLTVTLNRPASADDVNQALREAAATGLRDVLAVCDEELVSSDFLHDSHSAIVDAPLTMAIGDRTVKVMAWYDNEWGYSCRLLDLVQLVRRDAS
jgi:glyceraldehyde 3-phosphate dehydrogenase